MYWIWNLGEKKIVFFGDSVTYGGSYIDDTKTFVHISCEDFKNIKIICGNAGVNAYGIHNIVYRSKYDKRIGEIPVYFGGLIHPVNIALVVFSAEKSGIKAASTLLI